MTSKQTVSLLHVEIFANVANNVQLAIRSKMNENGTGGLGKETA